MLILSRKLNEKIVIGDKIEVSVVDIKGDQIKLGISAPRDVKVYRREVYEEILQENAAAAQSNPAVLPDLKGVWNPGQESPGSGTSGSGTSGSGTSGSPPPSLPSQS